MTDSLKSATQSRLERHQDFRLEIVKKILEIDEIVQLDVEDQLKIVDQFFNYVVKGTINDKTKDS